MLGMKRAARTSRVRTTVVRRTIVGSLVVMLSPFLFALDNEADASVHHRTPVVHQSAPAQLQTASAKLVTLRRHDSTYMYIASIRDDIRATAERTWSH